VSEDTVKVPQAFLDAVYDMLYAADSLEASWDVGDLALPVRSLLTARDRVRELNPE